MEHHATYVTEAQREEQLKAIRALREREDRPESYFIVTYGCQMNAHDSEKLAGLLEEMGMTEAEDRTKADLVLFNTCCVRDNAERRALGNEDPQAVSLYRSGFRHPQPARAAGHAAAPVPAAHPGGQHFP